MYVPPAPGMAAPSSAQMRPSASERIAPMIQPNIASGPPMVATMAGIVTNGPMPHIWVMLIAVACSGPIWRSSDGCPVVAALVDGDPTTHLLQSFCLLGKFLNILSASVREFACKISKSTGREVAVDSRAAPQAGTPASMRALNQRLVLDRLRDHGETTRPEIAANTGLSKPTVGQALLDLEQHGLVRAIGRRADRPGRA